MDSGIKEMMDSLISGFSVYPIEGSDKEAEYRLFVENLTRLGETSGDLNQFIDAYSHSGLGEKAAELHQHFAVAMMSQSVPQQKENSPEPIANRLLTVEEFLAPHRMAYEEIKKCGYRKKTENLYEEILSVANQTEDLLDAQLLLEEKGLLHQLTFIGMEEVDEFSRSATDPLDEVLIHRPFVHPDQMACYYETLDEIKKRRFVGEVKNHLFYSFMVELLSYEVRKKEILQWKSSSSVQRDVIAMNRNRRNLKHMIPRVEQVLGQKMEDLLRNQYIRILFLSPEPLVELGRVKKVLHPQNLLAIEELVREEIQSSLTLAEILTRQPEHYFYFDVERGARDLEAKYRALARDYVKDLDFFKYHMDGQQGPSVADLGKSMEAKDNWGNMPEGLKDFSTNS